MKNTLLFDLIHSLTRNEKGYFVKNNSLKNKLFLSLYSGIENQKEYNELTIRKKFKGTYIEKNFSFAKNYLYNAILKNLIQFNFKKKDKYYYFNSVELLYKKGLYKHCEKLLIQIHKKANIKNDYLSLLRIIEFSKLILASNLRYSDALNDIVSYEADVLKAQQITSTFQSILIKIKQYRENTGNMINEDLYTIKDLIETPFLKDKSNIINLQCKKMYHEILFLYAFIFNRYDIALRHSNELQQIIFHSKQKVLYLTSYEKFELISHIIRFNILSNNHQLALANIKKSNQIIITSDFINPTEKNIMLLRNLIFETDIFLLSKQSNEFNESFDKAVLLVKQNKLKSYIKQLYKILLANKICHYFLIKDYKSTLLEINNLLHYEKKEVRSDIILFIKLTEMAIFYDRKNMTLLNSRALSFKRDLIKAKVTDQLWKTYSTFFSLTDTNNIDNSHIKNTIALINKAPKTRLKLDLFHIENWLKQKSD